MPFNTKPTVVDLFAGAGLFSKAFEREGFQIKQAVENDPMAAATYIRNMGNHLSMADVRSVVPKGKCDVIVAGPPCQGFSTMSRMRDDNDPRNFLALDIVRWAKVLKPKIIVIENVIPFLDSPVCKKLKKLFQSLGYDLSTGIYNAVNFNVAQYRDRCFVIASQVGPPEIKSRKDKEFKTVRQAWEGLSSKPNGRNHHIAPIPSPLTMARIKMIPPEGDRAQLIERAPHLVPPSLLRLKSGVSDVWGRMLWDEPSNTIRTFMIHPSKGRYIHPVQDRVLSLREAARLQDIPDSWAFEGKITHVARQIGNSVPLGLARAIAKAVSQVLVR